MKQPEINHVKVYILYIKSYTCFISGNFIIFTNHNVKKVL